MQLPMPPKVAAALQILSFYDTVEFAENVNHPARRLTRLEAACRDSAISMLNQWFMGEIDLDGVKMVASADLEAEINRQIGRGLGANRPDDDDDDDEEMIVLED